MKFPLHEIFQPTKYFHSWTSTSRKLFNWWNFQLIKYSDSQDFKLYSTRSFSRQTIFTCELLICENDRPTKYFSLVNFYLSVDKKLLADKYSNRQSIFTCELPAYKNIWNLHLITFRTRIPRNCSASKKFEIFTRKTSHSTKTSADKDIFTCELLLENVHPHKIFYDRTKLILVIFINRRIFYNRKLLPHESFRRRNIWILQTFRPTKYFKLPSHETDKYLESSLHEKFSPKQIFSLDKLPLHKTFHPNKYLKLLLHEKFSAKQIFSLDKRPLRENCQSVKIFKIFIPINFRPDKVFWIFTHENFHPQNFSVDKYFHLWTHKNFSVDKVF